MDKIITYLKNLDADKVLHILISMAITFIASGIVRLFTRDAVTVVALGWLAGFLFGFYKELRDEVTGDDSSSADWLADVIGITIAALLVVFLVI